MSGVLIVGTGDHARVVVDLVHAVGLRVSGHVEPAQERARAWRSDGSMVVLGALDDDLGWLGQLANVPFVVAIGANEVRRRAFERCRELGMEPVPVVHPTAALLGRAAVRPGAQVCAMATLGVDSSIGENVIINTAAVVDHDGVVEPHAFIGPGARLAGRVRVGAGAHVGIGAVIREGTMIGAGALVAAGAVVVEDVPEGARVAGVPARPMESARG